MRRICQRISQRLSQRPTGKLCWSALVLAAWLPGAALAVGGDDSPLSAIVGAAREVGLPAEVLESKIREGQLKRVPPERLLAVIEGLKNDLQRSRDALTGWPGMGTPDAEAIVAGAQALRSGVDLGALAAAMEMEQALAPEAVIRLATDLRLRGVPSADSNRLAARVAKAGSAADVARVLAALDRLRAAGGDAGAAATALMGAADRLDARRDARQGFGPWLDALGTPQGAPGTPGSKGLDPDLSGAAATQGQKVPPGQVKKGTSEPPATGSGKVPPGQAKDGPSAGGGANPPGQQKKDDDEGGEQTAGAGEEGKGKGESADKGKGESADKGSGNKGAEGQGDEERASARERSDRAGSGGQGAGADERSRAEGGFDAGRGMSPAGLPVDGRGIEPRPSRVPTPAAIEQVPERDQRPLRGGRDGRGARAPEGMRR